MHTLTANTTDIPGLLLLHLPVQHNDVGWFKEDWHREKMAALGLPDFRPVQHNVTHNDSRGITRGFHAEPWDRLISVVSGRAMGAWVDLRDGDSYGTVVTADLDSGIAVFVPRGVANAHQVLQDHTTFSYLLNHHWTPEARAQFSAVNLYDPALGISWPIPRPEADLGRADAHLPAFADVTPMPSRRILVAGTDTPLGRALLEELPGASGYSAAALHPAARAASPIDLSGYDTLINAQGETGEGTRRGPRRPPSSWTSAADDARHLADIARRHRMRYVHVSVDGMYERDSPTHTEGDAFSLLDPHSQGLVIAEVVAATVPRHLVIRTGWVIGAEERIIDDLVAAARHGRLPGLDSARHGRLTYAHTLASGIMHLLNSGAASGTYNLTGEGPLVSWAEVGRRVFSLCAPASDTSAVDSVPTASPSHGSALDLTRIRTEGFRPGNSWLELADHLAGMDAARSLHARTDASQPAAHDPAPALESIEKRRRRPYRVLFLCTANICRSAYADVVSRGAGTTGVEYASAGTHALVGHPMDPPMAQLVGDRGNAASHRARQVTRQMVDEADLVLTMGKEHRRYILDEWPDLGRKIFPIGHAARELSHLPHDVTLPDLSSFLWKRRAAHFTDEVADPYGRGAEAAATCADLIDAHLETTLEKFRTMMDETENT